MKKELKYFFYVTIILGFLIFVVNYYFSDQNKKNSYRSFISHDAKIKKSNFDLITLESDTENIIEYVENNTGKDKIKYKFWNLLDNDKK